MSEITMYPINMFEKHPNNPRKDLGNLTELSDSISKFGVLQNLIVVKNGDKLRVVGGHRRLAAAKLAGLTELPAVIRELDEKEQQQIMLTENLQRTDLSLLEQAQGFQMLIDLGSTVKDLSKETGFAESTIKHRLAIAKLDPDIIKRSQAKQGEQLRLSDFIALEKIKDIEKRNDLLAQHGGSSDFLYYVNQEKKRQDEAEIIKRINKQAISLGMEEREANSWDSDIKDSMSIWINDYEKSTELPETSFFCNKSSYILFYNLKTEEDVKKEQDEKEYERANSKYVKAQKIRYDIREIVNGMNSSICHFAEHMIDELKGKDKDDFILGLMQIIFAHYESYEIDDENLEAVISMITEKNDALTPDFLIIEMLFSIITFARKFDYREQFFEDYKSIEDDPHEFPMAEDMLWHLVEPLGFKWTDEEQLIIEGKHALQTELQKFI